MKTLIEMLEEWEEWDEMKKDQIKKNILDKINNNKRIKKESKIYKEIFIIHFTYANPLYTAIIPSTVITYLDETFKQHKVSSTIKSLSLYIQAEMAM